MAKDILTFLTLNNNYQATVLHGFSVGGYLWGEALNLMGQDMQQYQPVIKNVSCFLKKIGNINRFFRFFLNRSLDDEVLLISF